MMNKPAKVTNGSTMARWSMAESIVERSWSRGFQISAPTAARANHIVTPHGSSVEGDPQGLCSMLAGGNVLPTEELGS